MAEARGASGSPPLCIHGSTDTWRTWNLVRPALERNQDVLAITLPGHAGDPPMSDATPAYAVAAEMERQGIAEAHAVGNSLGAHVALQLAAQVVRAKRRCARARRRPGGRIA